MTDATASAPTTSRKTTGGAFYRLVWKWHFLASLYVLPFMAMLAITGVFIFINRKSKHGFMPTD